MFKWFFRNKEIKKIKEETKRGFESVKKDINSVGEWIKHLNIEKDMQKKEIRSIKENLSSVQNEIEELKNIVSAINGLKLNRIIKPSKQLFNKQTPVYAVQTGVQTGVQTPNLNQFSITERAILWVLLNSDMKLSYEDLARILGKERSTIRGQINTIKQKSECLIRETIEKNGKKRIYIPEDIKEKIFKKHKKRTNKKKIEKKIEPN